MSNQGSLQFRRSFFVFYSLNFAEMQGIWSSPSPVCSPVRCIAPHWPPNNGRMLCSNQNNPGSICRLVKWLQLVMLIAVLIILRLHQLPFIFYQLPHRGFDNLWRRESNGRAHASSLSPVFPTSWDNWIGPTG